jgi:hypothetical protein
MAMLPHRKTTSLRARAQAQADARLSSRGAHDLQLVELVWIQRDHSRFFPPDQTDVTGAKAVTVAGAGAGWELVLVLLLASSLPATPNLGSWDHV